MKRIILVFVVSAIALLLVACGGSEPEAPPPVTVTVEGLDTFQFNPATLSAPAGAQVNLTFKNGGGLEHNFVMVAGDTDTLTVTEADAFGGINVGTVSAGGEKMYTFTAPAAGTYKYVCTIPGHAAGGMVGTFTSQ